MLLILILTSPYYSYPCSFLALTGDQEVLICVCLWIGGFGVYLVLGILDQDDLYKELMRKAVVNIKILFMMTSFKFCLFIMSP